MIRRSHIFIFLCIPFSTILSADELVDSDLWDRPVIIGASVSDGFHHTETIGGPKSENLAIDLYLQNLLKNPKTKITNLSNRLCFFSPLIIAHKQIFDAQQKNPSVIIAVDQLFWHLYGRFPSSEDRLKTFQNALDNLSAIECPLIIGNIPDASEAVRIMLSVSQVPTLDTINKANEILNEWVDKRIKNKQPTAIIDLAGFMRLCVANEEIKLSNVTYPAGTTRDFLQIDMLHPTPAGISAISQAVMDSVKPLQLAKP